MVDEMGNSRIETMRMGAAGEMLGRLREQAVAMSEPARIERAGRRGLWQRRRHRALSDIDLAFREVGAVAAGTPKFSASTSGDIWPSQSVIEKVPNSEK